MASTAEILEERYIARKALPTRVLSGLRRFARREPVGAAAAVVFGLIILMAVFAPVIAPYGPTEADRIGLHGPTQEHIFGTDRQGWDIFSRVIWGSRISVSVGIVTVFASLVFASLLGLFSGFFSGAVDNVIMRVMDVGLAFPSLILALAMAAVLKDRFDNMLIVVMMVITITQIPPISRVARSAVIAVKENQYVEAAQAIGARDLRIIFRHIFPNVIPVLIVYGGTYIGYAIVTEASLSFLGVGIQPDQASWGSMISGQARTYLKRAPYLTIFPAIALTVTVLSANMLADALRDHLDPRLRGSR